MTEPVRVWVLPRGDDDLSPLPALVHGDNGFSFYDRRAKAFGPIEEAEEPVAAWLEKGVAFRAFEECRSAIAARRRLLLEQSREMSHLLASQIEHILSIPNEPFPNVIREVPEPQEQEAQRQEETETQAEKVKSANQPRKPNGRN